MCTCLILLQHSAVLSFRFSPKHFCRYLQRLPAATVAPDVAFTFIFHIRSTSISKSVYFNNTQVSFLRNLSAGIQASVSKHALSLSWSGHVCCVSRFCLLLLLLLLLCCCCCCCCCCLLSQAFSSWYFSQTNGDPHRSGFKFQTKVLSVLLVCVMFQV